MRHVTVATRTGAVAPLVAILLPVLLTLVAFAIQFSFHDLARTEMRIAVDAAAEAGARTLSETGSMPQAAAEAKDAASRNTIGGEPCILQDSEIEFGHVTRPSLTSKYEFSPSTTNPTAVRIVGTQQRSHIFQVLSDTLTVRAAAMAGQIDRDIAIVLDRSGSMVYVQDDGSPSNWTDGEPAPNNSRWVKAAQAASSFLDTLTKDTPMAEKVSLITYNGTGTVNEPLTFTYTNLLSAIDYYTQNYEDGSTNIADGIEQGRQSLLAAAGRPWAAKTIVVMTDGKHNTGSISPQDAATAAAGQGIVIHTITYGDDADQTVMQEVAQIGGGQHWHAPNSGSLLGVFRDIADNLPTMLME